MQDKNTSRYICIMSSIPPTSYVNSSIGWEAHHRLRRAVRSGIHPHGELHRNGSLCSSCIGRILATVKAALQTLLDRQEHMTHMVGKPRTTCGAAIPSDQHLYRCLSPRAASCGESPVSAVEETVHRCNAAAGCLHGVQSAIDRI